MSCLICPVCQAPLALLPNARSYTCPNKHLFDRAKQGYTNLLLNQHKKSKIPGDTAEMVAARTCFLNAGYYLPVVDAMLALFRSSMEDIQTPGKPLNFADIACGEGYYTHLLSRSFEQLFSGQTCNTTGIDISTPAIKAACKRDRDITWLVGNATALPIGNNSLQLGTCLFCRVDYTEAHRVLAPDGLFLVAQTGPKHLLELRQAIYDEIKQHSGSSSPAPDQTLFTLRESSKLVRKITVESGEMLMNLLKMTPHYWRSSAEARNLLGSLNSMEITVDIELKLHQKTAGAKPE